MDKWAQRTKNKKIIIYIIEKNFCLDKQKFTADFKKNLYSVTIL